MKLPEAIKIAAVIVAEERAAASRHIEHGNRMGPEIAKTFAKPSFAAAKTRESRARALDLLISECRTPSGFGLVRQWWANIEYKWSGTVLLRLFSKKDMREDRQAVVPVLVVRDTPAARKALGYKQT